jgi:hypothetical protein
VQHRHGSRDASDGDRVIAPMQVRVTRLPLLFDVRHFAARRDFAVASDNATASQGGESEKPDHAHAATLTVGPPTEPLTPRGCLPFRSLQSVPDVSKFRSASRTGPSRTVVSAVLRNWLLQITENPREPNRWPLAYQLRSEHPWRFLDRDLRKPGSSAATLWSGNRHSLSVLDGVARPQPDRRHGNSCLAPQTLLELQVCGRGDAQMTTGINSPTAGLVRILLSGQPRLSVCGARHQRSRPLTWSDRSRARERDRSTLAGRGETGAGGG